MMYIVYCVETHGECVENGVGSVELFHNPGVERRYSMP